MNWKIVEKPDALVAQEWWVMDPRETPGLVAACTRSDFARLLVAAPELLAVARWLVAWDEPDSGHDPARELRLICKAARAAIAKVEQPHD